MNKKNNLAYVALFLVGLLSSLTLDTSAQQRTWVEGNQPQKPIVEHNLLQNYIKISSLPNNKRPKAFSDLPAYDKANVFKMNLALQFAKRDNLSKEQKDLILEAISMVTPATYDRENIEKRVKSERDALKLQDKSLGIFSPQVAFEIFASIGGNEEDTKNLQKYQNTVSLPTMLKRRKSFRESMPADRSSLWKAQMAYYLATEKLSKPQQDFILEVITLSTIEAFDFPSVKGASKNDATKSLDALEPKAFKLFPKEDFFRFFMSLGPAEKILLQNSASNDFVPEEGTACGCVWWCSPCHSCSTGNCDETTSGCGWSLGSPCTGKCVFNMNTCPR